MTTAEIDFAYRIDRWDTQGRNIIQHIANVDDLRAGDGSLRGCLQTLARGDHHVAGGCPRY